eukprot:c5305_g1_i1.p1 GENE.c5305_g1_i1~~c5305_g1_i1.p1  ORF type:complete len:294 (+),score=65.88 c5305_g1_i1:41-922(+)
MFGGVGRVGALRAGCALLAPKKAVGVFRPAVISPELPHAIQKMLKKISVHPLEEAAANSGFSEPWDYASAPLLERLPVVTPTVSPLEINYEIMSHSLRELNAKKYPEEWTRTEQSTVKNDAGETVTAESQPQRKLAPKKGTLEAFEPAPRYTAADEAGDVHSTKRNLEGRLYLVVKSKADGIWKFPEEKFESDWNMRYLAEEIVVLDIGQPQAYFVGYAPIACHKIEYSDVVKSKLNRFGMKTFYYRAQYLKGDIQINTNKYSDYAWLTRQELRAYLSPDVVDTLLPVLPAWH